jgi:hypothetical protein
MMEKVINFPRTVYNLFVNSKFSVHRIFGLLYLIQWFSALFPEMAKPTSTHQNQMGWNPRLSTQKPTWVFGFLGSLKYIRCYSTIHHRTSIAQRITLQAL